MFILRYLLIVLLLDLTNNAAISAQSAEGKSCVLRSGRGTCRDVNQCKSVYNQIHHTGQLPELICDEDEDRGTQLIVCCPNSEENISRTSTTNTSGSRLTTAWNFWSTTARTTVTTDRKVMLPTGKRPAEIMCSKYISEAPKIEAQKLNNGVLQLVNVSFCENPLPVALVIVGGLFANSKEFASIAAIGYPSGNQILWRCGGTLISETFVLTAAHCLMSGDGPPKLVRVGDLDLSRTNDDAKPQERKIAKMIKHPNYHRLQRYHDIALLKLDSPVTFNEYVMPSCLSLEPQFPDGMNSVAAGWGLLKDDGLPSNLLMKISLPIVSHAKCYPSYTKKLPNGLDDKSQLCAGGQRDRDTCQGDSGGPLLIPNSKEKCLHDVIGVTSFGDGCGSIYPAIYTRVYNYVSWIESIVWPDLN